MPSSFGLIWILAVETIKQFSSYKQVGTSKLRMKVDVPVKRTCYWNHFLKFHVGGGVLNKNKNLLDAGTAGC